MQEGKLDYWDWVSSQDTLDVTDKEDITELLKECYEWIAPYLERMFWVDANVIYLNKIHRVPQRDIGGYLGISQLGVSKRIRSAMKKLKLRVKEPELDLTIVKDELAQILPPAHHSVAMLIYTYQCKSVVIRLLQIRNKEYNRWIDEILRKIQEQYDKKHPIAVKYHEFFNMLNSDLVTVGDYLFKREDYSRSKEFDLTRK